MFDRPFPEIQPIPFHGRVLFHTGPHKTGTTTIQAFLARNRGRLLDQGVLYPEAGRLRGQRLLNLHHPLVVSLAEADPIAFQHHAEAMAREIGRTYPDTVLISTEALAREVLPETVYPALIRLFAHAKRDWLLYLRRQDDLLVSLYQERVKRCLSSWPERIEACDRPELLDHMFRIEQLRARVGTDTILVKSFEKARHRLIDAFLEDAGIAPDLRFEQVASSNASLPRATVQALRYANAAPGPLRDAARWVTWRGFGMLRRSGVRLRRGSTLLDSAARERILARYRESNRQIDALYFDEDGSGLPV